MVSFIGRENRSTPEKTRLEGVASPLYYKTDTEIITFIVNWIFYIAAKKEEKKPEPESESDEDMGFGLFD